MSKKRKRYRLKKKIVVMDSLCAIFLIICCLFIFRLLKTSPIILTSSHEQIEINSVIDFSQFIKEIKNGDIQDVQIDASKVHLNQLGQYEVIYSWDKYQETLIVEIVDTTPPQVEVQNLTIALNQNIQPEDFITRIIDQTNTTTQFADNYDFSQLGHQEIEILVKDESNNQTVIQAQVEIVKDIQAPQILIDSISIMVNDQKTDLKEKIKVRDDFDLSPEIIIEDTNVKRTQKGSYPLLVIVKDFSGNQTKKTITVHVKGEGESIEKVVYLTFDDGPSQNTQAVLDILEKYHCYATFFITGMNKKYYPYIQKAYNAGHTIGLHTFSHQYSKIYSSPEAYFQDLDKIGQLAKKYIGYVPTYIRFPGGSSNTVSRQYCQGIMSKLTQMVEDKGYQYFDWNVENGDGYSSLSRDEMIKRATSSSEDEIMILMHDASGKETTVDILPIIIEYYLDRGYIFKAIDESSFVPHQNVKN